MAQKSANTNELQQAMSKVVVKTEKVGTKDVPRVAFQGERVYTEKSVEVKTEKVEPKSEPRAAFQGERVYSEKSNKWVGRTRCGTQGGVYTELFEKNGWDSISCSGPLLDRRVAVPPRSPPRPVLLHPLQRAR